MTIHGFLWALLLSGIAIICNGGWLVLIIAWPIYIYQGYKILQKHPSDDNANLFVMRLIAGIAIIIFSLVVAIAIL